MPSYQSYKKVIKFTKVTTTKYSFFKRKNTHFTFFKYATQPTLGLFSIFRGFKVFT